MSEIPASEPAYQRNPYLTTLEVEVIRAGDDRGRPFAVLDDTVLYPEGGGQPADHGKLGAIAITDVQRVDGEIRHYLGVSCAPGRAVLTLDWGRRFDLMQQHTAQHLLSALALNRFGWATRSFHLGAETSDIELDAAELPRTELDALEGAAMAEVVAARAVSTRRVTSEEYARLEVRSRGLPASHTGDIRLVEIDGIDRNTCGGTHLRTTAEIEVVKILDTERLRGGTRVRWVAGGRVRRRLATHEARNSALRELFDSDDASLAEIAGLKLEQLANQRRRIRHLELDLAAARATALAASDDPVVDAHYKNVDGGFLQQVARSLLEQAPAKAALLTATRDASSFFLVAAGAESPLDAAETGARIAETLGGRGGGSGGIHQGKAGSLERRDAAVQMLRRGNEGSP